MNINQARLLVVDDNASMRGVIRSVLDELGIVEVDEAEDGEVALRLFSEGAYGLVITDLYMPRLDGIGLLQAIRSASERQDTPVLILTGDDNPMRGVEALTAGADGFIVKPFITSSLFDQVPRLLARAHPSASESGVRDIRGVGPSVRSARPDEPALPARRTRDSA